MTGGLNKASHVLSLSHQKTDIERLCLSPPSRNVITESGIFGSSSVPKHFSVAGLNTMCVDIDTSNCSDAVQANTFSTSQPGLTRIYYN